MRGISRKLALFSFLAAIGLAAFLAGMVAESSGSFPSDLVDDATKTLAVNLDFRDGPFSRFRRVPSTVEDLRKDSGFMTLQREVTNVALSDVATARVEIVASTGPDDAALPEPLFVDPIMVKGEVGAFQDECPVPWGCLAVEYSRSGTIRRAWPFRPEEIAKANIVSESDYPYEHPLDWSLARGGVGTFHLATYPNDDILVAFHIDASFPYGGGVARVAPDGRPRWYRKDYSHHWPHVVSDDLALVPAMRLQRQRLSHDFEGDGKAELVLNCKKSAIIEDQVNVVDGRGEVLEQISIIDAILNSAYATMLYDARGCDPAHLNFVHVLGADAGGAAGIAPGDLVVSLRNLSAFGILDKDDRRLKRFVRGSFYRQHGVRHLDGARFIMFDNLGSDGVHPSSRLLMVDLASGEETTVFPNRATEEHLKLHLQRWSGQFDVSNDRRRAWVTDVRAGRALEFRLADGKVLSVFHHLHDLSSTGLPEAMTKNPWAFEFHGIYYANRWTPSDGPQ